MSDERRMQGGLSVKTLLVAAGASAAAALLIPLVWRPGTVFAAAMTPIVVALASEILRRPVETVSTVAVRRGARVGVPLDRRADEAFDPLAPPPTEELEALPETIAPRPRVEHRRRALTRAQWKLALVTGLVAFVVVATLFTASELLAGDAASGGDKRTTFFGGSSSKRDKASDASEAEREARERDAEESATPTAEPSVTPTPTPTATVTATATPTPLPGATPTPPGADAQPAAPTPIP